MTGTGVMLVARVPVRVVHIPHTCACYAWSSRGPPGGGGMEQLMNTHMIITTNCCCCGAPTGRAYLPRPLGGVLRWWEMG